MKNLPYFKWYPADADTDANFRAMDDADIGFYIRCLNHAWINGGIPSDPKERARVLRTRLDTANKRWERVGKSFLKSSLYPDQLTNLRQETERELACCKSLKAAESVNHRYERTTNVPPRALATETETELETENPPKPPAPAGAETSQKRPRSQGTLDLEKALGDRLPWWVNFWDVYPLKVAKQPAMSVFERRVHDYNLAAKIWKGAKRYAEQFAADPAMPLAHPATWLNQERWNDENLIRPAKLSASAQALLWAKEEALKNAGA